MTTVPNGEWRCPRCRGKLVIEQEEWDRVRRLVTMWKGFTIALIMLIVLGLWLAWLLAAISRL